jgi:cell division protein FtsQ
LVKAAVRVGGRRWNLRLKSGADVQLPEDDTAAAWNRLAEYERSHQVLKREIRILDLRLPDRLIVRESPRSILGDKRRGQET